MGKKKKDQVLTYPGQVFDAEDTDLFYIIELMRRFQSSQRFSRERIFDGLTRKEIEEKTKKLFIPNSRYMRDAHLVAEANISSQEELQPMYVVQYKQAIEKIETKIQKLSKSKRKNKDDIIASKQSRVRKLTKKMNFYQHHIDNGTVSKTIDGTKALLRLLNQGKITKSDWREARSNQLFSRGEASKGGNENMKLEHVKDNVFFLRVLNPLSGKKGDRIVLPVRFPDKFVATIVTYLATGKAYTVRLKRHQGKFTVHLSLDSTNTVEPDVTNGCAGIDINPDNLSVTITHPNGNFRASKVFWMHDINTVSADKRQWIIENTVIQAMLWIQSFGVTTLAIEELKFSQKHSSSSSYNRMIHNFSYKKIVNAIISTCFKENIALVEVPAYYSSLIGRVKYQKQYGLSVHQSAAFVLARRAMRFEEKIPKELVLVLFAKEAKKGHQPSDLFKHWKKVSTWLSNIQQELYKIGFPYKSWYFDDYVAFCKNYLTKNLFAV